MSRWQPSWRDFVVGVAAVFTTLGVQFVTRRWHKLVSRQAPSALPARVDHAPRFPEEVEKLLLSSTLCYLGVTLEDGTNHQSLMIFTYMPQERRLLLSTRRDTTKFEALSRMKRVALLVHDLGASDSAAARLPKKTLSITLKGEVTILSDLDADYGVESPRSKHLERHGSEYEQFIVGENVSMLSVSIESVQICDANDQVQKWTATVQPSATLDSNRASNAAENTEKRPQSAKTRSKLSPIPPQVAVPSREAQTDLEPPFPLEVVGQLLSASSCHLGVTLPDGTSHLCLMIFTYIPQEQRVLLSTRRNTAKFQAISQLTRVTMLLHDLDASDAAAARLPTKTNSITLYGEVAILSDTVAEPYRAVHLARHGSEYQQFIVGEDIAMLSVSIESMRICNSSDKVKRWTRKLDGVVPAVAGPAAQDVLG